MNTLVDANPPGVLRLDYNITDNTRTYVRLARDTESTQTRAPVVAAGEHPAPHADPGKSLARSAVANVTSVLSPTATKRDHLSYSALKPTTGWTIRPGCGRRTRAPASRTRSGTPVHPGRRDELPARSQHWAAQDVDKSSPTTDSRASPTIHQVLNTHAVKVGGIVERIQAAELPHQNNVQLVFAPWGNGARGTSSPTCSRAGRPRPRWASLPPSATSWPGTTSSSCRTRGRPARTSRWSRLRVGKWRTTADQRPGRDLRPSAVTTERGYLPRCPEAAAQRRGLCDGIVTTSRDARPLLIMPRVKLRLGPQRGNATRWCAAAAASSTTASRASPVQHHQTWPRTPTR